MTEVSSAPSGAGQGPASEVTGKFITLEGGEGAGKSTQANRLRDRLEARGHSVVLTREPGGSPRAEQIRELLLSGRIEQFGALAEATLFYAARHSHLEITIRPALKAGKWVVCDRFSDSTRAYQGAGGEVPLSVLEALERTIVWPTRPDLTLILDLPAELALERLAGSEKDRYEKMPLAFHQNLRSEFLNIASCEPWRCAVVDASADPDAVEAAIWKVVQERLRP